MAPELYNVSAPGSLMLFGEHAVLHGKQAIVCAVDKRLYIELEPQAGTQISITDTRLGSIELNINAIQIQPPFKFVLAAITKFSQRLPSGFKLRINSEFSSVIGFGSSAAVTVATIAVLLRWLDQQVAPSATIFLLAKQVMLELQGAGSGADLAASIYGGVLGYAVNDNITEQLPLIPELTALYAGYKTPTPEVIRKVVAAEQQEPEKFAAIYQSMHDCSMQAISVIKQNDWKALGKLFNQHHALQRELGTSDAVLENLANTLVAQAEVYGAKISGAGLGDCVIGLGAVERQLFAANDNILQFPVRITQQGLICN
jgi:mevalonate kinase